MIIMKGLGENLAIEWSEDAKCSAIKMALEDLKSRPQEGVRQLEALAEQGSRLAQLYLGHSYMYAPHGIKKDRTKAMKWLTLAYKEGSIEAGFHLAKMYEYQDDLANAIDIYESLGKRGFSPAFHSLGCTYFEQKNYEDSIDRAIDCFTKGMRLGHLHSWSWLLYLTRGKDFTFFQRLKRILSRIKLAALLFYYLFFRDYSDRVRR